MANGIYQRPSSDITSGLAGLGVTGAQRAIAPNPFYVHPGGEWGPGLTGLASSLGQLEDVNIFGRGQEEIERKGAAGKLKLSNLLSAAASIFKRGDPDEIAEFSLKNPEIAKSITEQAKFKNEQTKENYIRSLFNAIQDPGQIPNIAARRVEFLQSQGLDPKEMQNTMNVVQRYEQDPEGTVESMKNELAFMAPDRWKAYQKATGEIDAETKVGAQEILEDGTIIQSTAKGPVVYNPLGVKVTGQAAADAIAMGRAEKVSNLRKAAGEKKKATLQSELDLKGKVEADVISKKDAVKASNEAHDKLKDIDQNIANIDEAIQLIDDGAQTGFIMSKLPSIRASSVKLDNLQGRLGLDVLRTTTFGALSAAELKFALSTALPKGLEGPELKKWLIQKKEAQTKLSDYLESAAIYLGTPGNTKSGWLKEQRERIKTAAEGTEVNQEYINQLRQKAFGGQ